MRGRIRSIKPEVHLDDDLWDLEVRTGLPLFRLFVGLWNYADREGRFEWRPKRLKTVILPYWDGNPEAAMQALVEGGFIVRYEVDGRPLGVVRTFSRHQLINNREEPSKLPAPGKDDVPKLGRQETPADRQPRAVDESADPVDASSTRALPVNADASSTREARDDDAWGTPGKDREARGERGVGHAASGDRIGRDRKGSEGNGTLAPLGAGARVCDAREGGSFVDPTAGEVRTRFQALYQARFQALPYLGGGEVIATFADRLRGTARERGLDPLELLEVTFAAWAAKPLDEIAQNAPYAAFAARFGSLCKPNGANGSSELDELHAAQIAALGAKDFPRYQSLLAEERRRSGKTGAGGSK